MDNNELGRQTRAAAATGRRADRGMTLIEIMIVVAIIGLVMGMVGVAAVPQFLKAQCKTAWSEAQAAQQAVSNFQTENNGDCPGSIEDLVKGKYLTKAQDPWGQPLKLKKVENGDTCADVYSTGRNKQDESGSGDDVTGWAKTAEEACKPKTGN